MNRERKVKTSWMIIFLAVLMVSGAAAQDTTTLSSPKDEQSYALGMDLGNQLRKMSVDLDPALFGQGLKDALSGSKTLLTEEQVRRAISELQAEVKRKVANARKGTDDKAELALLAAYNQRAGETFLAQNKTKDGVVTLPSGLQYKILKTADGKKPTEADKVECHYRGTLLDGTEFDSSYTRGQPAILPVKALIKGWTEALQLMPVGSKWQIVIPPQLAYGEQGAGGAIGPNATLIFELDLLAIK
jgi:FKBP-type peptidyl-prolyl cis-trans isomerase